MARVALIWPSFYFYHIARFRAVFDKLGDKLLGIEIVGGMGDDYTGRWKYLERKDLPIITLFPNQDVRSIPRIKIGRELIKALQEFRADVVFVNGYSAQEFRMVIEWAKKNMVKCYTFSETKKDDFSRLFIKEWFKKGIVRKLYGAICGGHLHKEYLMELGMPGNRIFPGYDAVDNDFFREHSSLSKTQASENRIRYRLPEKYFISCSRFVRKKNLERLLTAYAIYRRMVLPDVPWSLVLVGEGPEEHKLKAKASRERIDAVVFAGSHDPKSLAAHYGLASCFILASTTEQWGLVINEAMACGLPVLATKVAGAASELIEEGVNGYSFDPYNTKQIAELMARMHRMDTESLAKMGSASQNKINFYSPEYFAENLLKALDS